MKEKVKSKKEKVKAHGAPSFAIGVDLGGTNLRIAAVDERGKLREKITTETRVARPRDEGARAALAVCCKGTGGAAA